MPVSARMRLRPVWLLCGLLPALAPAADVEALFALSLEELAQLEVSVATGTPRTLREAPAAASVITARELEGMGARHMDDALMAVPGLHVARAGLMYSTNYYFRGVAGIDNPHTLVLVNGIPMTSQLLGDRVLGWPGVPVQAIERIEIIRGPGSAVYGADAFGGVINIITKGPDDVARDQATLAVGSFGSREAGLLQRGAIAGWQTASSLEYRESDGDDSIIAADIASVLDGLLGTSASLAPGPVNRGYRTLDARSDLVRERWRLRGSLQRIWDYGTGAGALDALDPEGNFDNLFANIDLAWHDAGRLDGWDLEARTDAAFKQLAVGDTLFVLPRGTGCGGPICYADGAQQDYSAREVLAGIALTALYRNWQNHAVRLGTGYSWADLYETRDRKNTDQNNAPLPAMQDFSDTPFVFQPEAQRTITHVFVQDIWTLSPSLELTSGVRVDRYSDFGSTTNPRAALVWEATPAITAKLLYGEAFRAPAFAELYVQGVGNPNLKPEKLRNNGLGLNWRPSSSFNWDLNLFRYRIRDFIQISGGAALVRNVGRLEGAGGETEVRYQLPIPVQLALGYSTARLVYESTGDDKGLVPHHVTTLRATWDISPRWQLSGLWMNVGETSRQSDTLVPDTRANVPGYDTFDVNLRSRLTRHWDVTLTARNLFDAGYHEASNGPAPPFFVPNIPGDLPQPGRTLTLSARANW